MERLDERAPALTVLTPAGGEVHLRDLWARGPVLLVLVRHFGCVFCREQVGRLQVIAPEVRRLGFDIAVVGNGTPEEARVFAAGFGQGLAIYTDPTREVYRALGARRPGLRAVFDWRMYRNALRAYAAGFRQGRVQGDRAQLGGVFIVLPDGSLPFAHRSQVAGDAPDDDRVLEEVRRAAALVR